MARVAVVGVGAIGGAIAGLLETTGRHELTLCTRRPLQELHVTTPTGEVVVRARNLTDPADAGDVDWVLVATKTYDVEGTSAWIRRLGQKCSVAIIQNGVQHRERFAAVVEQERLLPVIIDCPVERRADGSIFQRGVAKMRVEKNRLGGEFAELFRGSAAQIEQTDDFLTAAWEKLCVNSGSAISALLKLPAGVIRHEGIPELAMAIVAECAAVGRAEGAKLGEQIVQQVIERYHKQPPDSINSTLADRIAGKPMEIDARNGVIVRKGKKHGIATPMNEAIVALLSALMAEAVELRNEHRPHGAGSCV
jgi:2-dehydropantoate 2-reductase